MTNSDKIFMEELKEEFKETVAKHIKEMPILHKKNKFAEIHRLAHDIKGMSGIFGLDEGSEIAQQLIEAAMNNDSEETKELIERLTSYMRKNAIIA
jgi:HPt (histidine-containing phosphotransfer) domain-containing protein